MTWGNKPKTEGEREKVGEKKGFPDGASGKEPACQSRGQRRQGFDPWVRNTPWRRAWQPTPVFLPGESHGQRSLVGYSLWGHKESDMTEGDLADERMREETGETWMGGRVVTVQEAKS